MSLQMEAFFAEQLINGWMFVRILGGQIGADALKASRSILQ